MGNLFLKILAAVAAGELVILYFLNGNIPQSKILAETAVVTATPTEIPTQSLSPTPEVTLSPTPPISLSTTPTPQPTFSSQEINGFIDRFSSQYNVSPHILRYIALCESGFDPSAIKLSYAGLYQFNQSTWKNMRREMGEDINPDLRLNAEEAVQTAAYVLNKNKAYIWPNCLPK